MPDAIEDFLQEFDRANAIQRSRIVESFRVSPNGAGDRRVALLEISRSIDARYHRTVLCKEDCDDSSECLYAAGGAPALATFCDAHAEREGVPLIASDEGLANWASSTILHLGALGRVTMLRDLVRDGVFSVTRATDGCFEGRPAAERIGIEALEHRDALLHRRARMKVDADGWKELTKRRPDVLARMRTLVRPWGEHMMGYGAHPDVDGYFDDAGFLWARSLDGSDELPSDASFGGIQFRDYCYAAVAFCSLALRHVEYMGEMLQLRPELAGRNLISTWSERSSWIDTIQKVLDTDNGSAVALVDALTMTPSSAPELRDRCSAAGAPLVQVAQDRLMLSIRGSLDAPFWYLLRSLRTRFRADWDRIVDAREHQFRKEVNELLASSTNFTSSRSIRIPGSTGTATDIDAAAFDRSTGEVMLFQLKWQDPWGSSMRERRSKMKNFLIPSRAWTERVRAWLADTSPSDVLGRLGVPASLHREVTQVHLMILGRHAARFSGPDTDVCGALVASYPQLARLAGSMGGRLGPIADSVRAEALRRVPPDDWLREEYHIAGLHVRVHGLRGVVTDGEETEPV